jgi:hypothetical protein
VKTLHRGQVTNAGSPGLVFVAQVEGRLVTPDALGYQIFDVSDETKFSTPLPVAGLVGSGGGGPPSPVALDLAADAITLGRYAVPWTVPIDAAEGRYRVRWTFALPNPLVPEQPWAGICEEDFEVTADPGLGTLDSQYCLVRDIRDEGLVDSTMSDARVQERIRRASLAIEQITGRVFEPRFMNVRSNATTSTTRALLFDMPIIGIERIDSPYLYDYYGVDLDLSSLRIANRHLRGLTTPDDRENPMIEIAHGDDDLAGVHFTRFYDGLAFVRHIQVVGVFGYTEANGSPAGQTPDAIRHATKLIFARELPRLADRDKREDASQRWRITSERSRDMSVNLQTPRVFGQAYGDPEIDVILSRYMRPPQMGAA